MLEATQKLLLLSPFHLVQYGGARPVLCCISVQCSAVRVTSPSSVTYEYQYSCIQALLFMRWWPKEKSLVATRLASNLKIKQTKSDKDIL